MKTDDVRLAFFCISITIKQMLLQILVEQSGLNLKPKDYEIYLSSFIQSVLQQD